MARLVAQTMTERLQAAARDVDDCVTALKLARQRRDQLVRAAIDDEGMAQRPVAAAAGITGPRVAAILAVDDEDDE